MALTRDQKAVQLDELKQNFEKAQSVIFAHYIGMTVSDVSDLRKKLRTSGAEMKVAKKTLMALAAKETNLPELPEEQLTGPVACIFSFNDPLTGAQIALKFSKDHPQVAFLGGLFEGKLLSKAEASALATIPSREVLLATFAGMLQSPLRSFMSICNSPLGGLARVISQMSEKGGFPGAPAAPAAAPTQTDATGDPIDPATGGRTEVVLQADLSSPASAVTETPAEAAPEGASSSSSPSSSSSSSSESSDSPTA